MYAVQAKKPYGWRYLTDEGRLNSVPSRAAMYATRVGADCAARVMMRHGEDARVVDMDTRTAVSWFSKGKDA